MNPDIQPIADQARFDSIPEAVRKDCLRYLMHKGGFLWSAFHSKNRGLLEIESDLLTYNVGHIAAFSGESWWMLTAWGRAVAHMELRRQEQTEGFKKPGGV